MSNPAPTLNQINAFNATQGTTIDFNIIGGTELVRSNRIYIYDLSDNSLICTHLYTSTESIHELPANTDGSIVYESGKSSADFVNGKQYYAQIQTFTDVGGTQGGSGLSVSKLFWCLVDPSLTIATIPSTISTTSYNVSATYNANTSVVSNIIQQYQFSLYSATGSLLQSSGVIVGNGTQQGTSTTYDISYNFSGLSVGSSYYVVVDVTTTQGMSVSAQSNTFTVSIDTPTLGEATVVNNACDGYISVTSNLSGEYGGSASGEIVSFETDSENVFTKLQVDLDPIQSGSGTPSPSNVRPISGHDEVEVDVVGVNLCDSLLTFGNIDSSGADSGTDARYVRTVGYTNVKPNTTLCFYAESSETVVQMYVLQYDINKSILSRDALYSGSEPVTSRYATFTTSQNTYYIRAFIFKVSAYTSTNNVKFSINYPSTDHDYHAYNGQTYTQDIEATYTPTVQENEPYQFKRTGDVGGDRESIELVGGSVAWNQLVQNGNFANTNNWSGQYCSISASGNVLTAEATAENVAGRIEQAVTLIAGHKYLFKENIKVSANATSRFAYRYSGGIKYTASLNATANTWGELATVFSADTQGDSGMLYLYYSNSTALAVGGTVQYKNVMLIDLTQMFGSTKADYIYSLEQANAGAGVAWFRKLFPKPYYAYNAGELMSVNTSAHNTVGFNAWDEEWEVGGINTSGQETTTSGYYRSKNYISVLPNANYYFKAPTSMNVMFYDANKGFIDWTTANNSTITTPSSCHYLRFRNSTAESWQPYNHDICINLSWDGERDGEYEEYVKHSYPLDSDLVLRGIPKLDASNNLYYDGDTYASDGTVTRKYGIVDLGTLTWNAPNGSGRTSASAGAKPIPSSTDLMNLICDKYITITARQWYDSTTTGIAFCGSGYGTDGNVGIVDPSFIGKTAEEVKTALSGIYLVYELATPTTETADQFEEIQICSPYGTEEFVDNRAVPIPVGNNTQYYTRDIYGGTLDLVSGVLTVDRLVITRNTADMNNNEEYPGWKDAIFNEYFGNGRNVIVDEPLNIGELYGVNTVAAIGAIWLPISTYGKTQSEWIVLAQDIQITIPLATPQTYQLTPQQIQTLVGTNNVWSEQGNIELSYHIPITNLLVKRQDVADVSGSWLTLYSQPVTQASDMDFTFIDFLNQYGKTYKYALVPLLTQTQSGVEVEVEGGYTVSDEVQSIFDGVFIADQTNVERVKAGAGYGNIDMNQGVGSITPIGSKYPIVITNSQNQYHNGSVRGTIVPNDFYSNGNLSRIDMVNKRDELEQFLTNKRAKIIKDWNGKMWLVMIMSNVNCSFDDNYGMGMVSFSADWLEVGDPTNQQDLYNAGLINVGGV